MTPQVSELLEKALTVSIQERVLLIERLLESLDVYGKPPRANDSVGIGAKRLLTEQQRFENSRDSLGLQLSDISDMWPLLAGVPSMIGFSSPVGIISEVCSFVISNREPGSSSLDPLLGHARKVCELLRRARAKGMLAERDR